MTVDPRDVHDEEVDVVLILLVVFVVRDVCIAEENGNALPMKIRSGPLDNPKRYDCTW